MSRIQFNGVFLRLWLILVFIITLVAGLVLLTEQQNYRLSANDPQIGLSENNATLQPSNGRAEMGGSTIDIRESLEPFTMTFDESGKLIETNISMEQIQHDTGSVPTVPAGVFDYTRANGQDRFTWQPMPNVRIAAVMTHFNNPAGFVLAGRSLREVENRESLLLTQIEVWWFVSMITSLLFAYCLEKFKFS